METSRRWLAAAAFAGLLVPAPAQASDQDVLTAATLAPRVSQAAARAAGGDPVAVQAQYDAARDLQEALAVVRPGGPACERLAALLGAYATAEVAATEGVDRQSPAQVARATRAGTRELARVDGARGACTGTRRASAPVARPGRIDDPGSYEAFFGAVRARAPGTAVSASVTFGARPAVRVAVTDGWVRTRIAAKPARGRLTVTFRAASGAVVGRSLSQSVWLLPPNAATATAATRHAPRLDAALARAAAGFTGISAVYTHDLTTGAEASWNDTARFPAASTVKLGVLAAALRRFGPHPEEQPSFYDLQALAGWSSNLAANRLARRIGGPAVAQAELRRLGAGSSTYRGSYTVGTALVPRSPPAVSATVTTARDLAQVLTTLQRVAVGDPQARARSGLSVHGARVALGLLLSSQPSGDNAGLLRPALGTALPMAQKQGWLRAARLTAAIVYSERGPRIVVICAYAPGLSRASAQQFGRRVAAVLALR